MTELHTTLPEHAIATGSVSLPVGRRSRQLPAVAASVVVHLALAGALWSAQVAQHVKFQLAGSRGSIALQASVAQPTPNETPIVERLLPTQVRVEPDHVHIDAQTLVTAPPISPPPLAELQPDGEAKELPPVDDVRPSHVHVHPHPHEHAATERRPTIAPPEVATPSNTATNAPSAAADATSTGHDETLPVLQFNPPPHYPAEASRLRIEGTTVLRLGVRADGRVEFVVVAETSGSRLLDDAAVEAVRQWRFTPGSVRGDAAPFVLRLPVTFRL